MTQEPAPEHREVLHQLLQAVDRGGTSTSKFRRFGEQLGALLRLPGSAIYCTSVRKRGNFKVRFEQSEAARESPIGVAVLDDSGDVARTIPQAQVLVASGTKQAVILYTRTASNNWSAVAFVEPNGGELGGR